MSPSWAGTSRASSNSKLKRALFLLKSMGTPPGDETGEQTAGRLSMARHEASPVSRFQGGTDAPYAGGSPQGGLGWGKRLSFQQSVPRKPTQALLQRLGREPRIRGVRQCPEELASVVAPVQVMQHPALEGVQRDHFMT